MYCQSFCFFLGREIGGQLSMTTAVENYPGFPDPVMGPDLMQDMVKQAKRVGTRIAGRDITNVDLKSYPFSAVDDNEEKYYANSIIIATGAQAKWLGLESEKYFQGFGVSSCATCDGFFFRNQDVLVIGGGNTAVEEALYLSGLVKSVTLVHRRDSLRAEKILQGRLFANKKIKVVWNSTVVEIIGEKGDNKCVTGVKIKDNLGNIKTLYVQGVFIAIGHKPNVHLFADQLECDEHGYIVTRENSTRTSINGVFAAGDVQDKIFRQAVTAAGTGCMAALEVEKFLASGSE